MIQYTRLLYLSLLHLNRHTQPFSGDRVVPTAHPFEQLFQGLLSFSAKLTCYILGDKVLLIEAMTPTPLCP